MKQFKVSLAMLCTPLLLCAQPKGTGVQAQLMPVNTEGFYAVPLTPELSGHAQANWQDLRIHDRNGKGVPYLLQAANRVPPSSSFQPFEVIERKNDTAFTTLVLRNPSGKGTGQLYLQMANTAVERFAAVSGSDN